MKNVENTSIYGSFASVYDTFVDKAVEKLLDELEEA